MKLYYVKDEYVQYLFSVDNKVSDNKHERRPYVGIVFKVNNIHYYVPLSSPKDKHATMKNTKDFRKIKGGEYGVINFNNMIPIIQEALIDLDIQKEEDAQYRALLQNQYRCIDDDKDNITKIANNLYNLCQKDDDELTSNDKKVKARCCNFKLLEEAIEPYRARVEAATGNELIHTDLF